MIENLSDYFVPEHEYYLQNISYNRLEGSASNSEHTMNCSENLSATIQDDKVTIVLERVVKFEPRDLFELSVSFGAKLSFNEYSDEIDWSSVKIAEEFYENGDFVLENLRSRLTLLIAQITSSYGLQPLILPFQRD